MQTKAITCAEVGLLRISGGLNTKSVKLRIRKIAKFWMILSEMNFTHLFQSFIICSSEMTKLHKNGNN